MPFTLLVNGSEHHVDAAPEETLLSVLRDQLQLTGTKYGCGEGQCGACTVLLEGSAVRSCRLQASAVVGKKITTIEGLARGEHLHPVQQAFLEAEAFQCGYCTSGMILSTVALLDHTNRPTDKQIVTQMNGNVCRCGTYERILQAVHTAAAMSRSKVNER
jgi:aerobic-type carbon monoxide dehydrogenase small subunit (CoxS/CutS family)